MLFQHFAEQFGLLDGNGADQHRLFALVAFQDLVNYGVVLRRGRLINDVGMVDPDHGLIGRNFHNIHAIDLLELLFLGEGCARHARKLFIKPEIVLERDGSQRLVFLFDLDAFLGLDGLVQAV